MVTYRNTRDGSLLVMEREHKGLEASGRYELVAEPAEPSGEEKDEGSKD